MIKKSASLTILFCSFLVLFNISETAAQQKLELELWNWLEDYENNFWDKAANEFNTMQDNYEIVMKYTVIPFVEMNPRFVNETNVENLPDILSIEYSQWPFFMTEERVSKLVPIRESSQRQDNRMSSTLVDYTFDGETYGIGFQAAPGVFVYNEDLLRSYGQNEPILYWEDFAELAQRFHEDGKNLAFFDAASANGWYRLFVQNNGLIFTEDGEYVFPDHRDAAIEALELVVTLYNNGIGQNPDFVIELLNGEHKDNFLNGNTGGVIAGDWIIPVLKQNFEPGELNWRLQSIPNWKNSSFSGVSIGGTGYAIVDKNHPESIQNVIEEFFLFATLSLRMQAAYYRDTMIQMSNIRLINNITVRQLEDPFFGGQKPAEILRQQVLNSAPRVINENMTDLLNNFDNYLIQAVNGTISPEQAIDQFLNYFDDAR